MIFDLIGMPLGLGLLCYLATQGPAPRSLGGAITALGVVLLFVSLWGLPPVPAVSSKHKIIYLLGAVAVAAFVVPRCSRPMQIVALLALGLGAFLWLNWRRLGAGLPLETLLLSAVILAGVGYGVWREEPQRDPPFLWPTELFVAMLGLGGVGLLSGYLGLGQAAGAVAALWAGMLLIPYALTLFGQSRPVPQGFTWGGFAVFAVLAIGLASFATNLHPLAVLCVIVALLSPLLSRRLVRLRSDLLRPILFAAVALPGAAAGILTAFLHF